MRPSLLPPRPSPPRRAQRFALRRNEPEPRPMKSRAQGRTQQLITAVLGLALTGFICAAMLLGLRAASELTARDAALQDAGALAARSNAPQQQKLPHEGAFAALSEASANATRL